MDTEGPKEGQKEEGLWRRMGLLGQVLTSLVGLLSALVPVLVATDAFSSGSTEHTVISPTPAPSTQQTATQQKTTQAADPIDLTLSDQLTEGALEETIVVVFEGAKIATLYANVNDPIVTQQVTATSPGNYDYVLDATIAWIDADGIRQEASATGHGSVYVDDGMQLDVYIHVDSGGGVNLSLQSASGS
ncbi:hypothetical protein OHA18_22965 [Kribbella sp. NBC_00709]|uniref:hypothetical protein n=1 Tax=Kribbella sp. NBC_00709 TaxID=2975972 RepID=UPI002E2D3A14|nr:hypothetical protein [Kribbella sp. NBC_00709]